MSGVDPAMWKALLAWSAKQTDLGAGGEGAAADAQARPMTEEDRDFIENAMKTFVVDEQARMDRFRELLSEKESDDNRKEWLEMKEEILDELLDWVEDLDHANDLHAIGGLLPLIDHLDSTQASLRWRAAAALGNMVQNNPKAQRQVTETGALKKLMRIMKTDEDITAKTKALYATSSLIRHNEEARRAFVDDDGVAILKTLVVSTDERLSKKALFLFHYLTSESKDICRLALKEGFLGAVVPRCGSKDLDTRDFAARVLLELMEADEEGLAKSMAKDLGLNVMLQDVERDIRESLDESRLQDEDTDTLKDQLRTIVRLREVCSSA